MASESSSIESLKEAAIAYAPAPLGVDSDEDQGWIDFRDQCRRQIGRPMAQRLKYGFCRMYKPVLDDAQWRAFDTMEDYRSWCEANLPEYLGFKRPAK